MIYVFPVCIVRPMLLDHTDLPFFDKPRHDATTHDYDRYLIPYSNLRYCTHNQLDIAGLRRLLFIAEHSWLDGVCSMGFRLFLGYRCTWIHI
jgi:hypothetical protein